MILKVKLNKEDYKLVFHFIYFLIDSFIIKFNLNF